MIHPLFPYRTIDVLNEVNYFVKSILLESGLDSEDFNENIKIHSERFLFTKESIETVKIILQIIDIFDYPIKELIKIIYKSLERKFGKIKIIRITIGDKVIEVPYSKDETIEVILTEIDK